jgi:hypothetical protein
MSHLLCAIPGCRIPGQHRDDCDQADCRACLPRPATDGYTCDECTGHMHQLLGVIADLAPDARAVAAGQARPGATRNGGSTNKPGSQSPLNDGATDALDEIHTDLAKIARAIANVRGLRGPQSHAEGRTPGDPLGTLCSWLSNQLEWVRHALDDQRQPYAPTVHATIRDAASRIRAIVNGPHARRYLGPCGAPIVDDDPPADVYAGCPNPGRCIASWDCHAGKCGTIPAPTCDGDVYGRPGATNATCRTCHTQHAQNDRQAWIGDITRDRAYRAAHIADAHGIHVKTIRSWADRGKLTAWWSDGEQLHEWTTLEVEDGTIEQVKARLAEIADEVKARGPRLFVLGDVLDLAAADAARREQLRASREAESVTTS